MTSEDSRLKSSTIEQAKFDYSPLGKIFRGGNNVDYDFSDYKTFKGLFRELYYKKPTIDYVERKQDEITEVKGALNAYAPRYDKYVEAKNKLVNDVKNFYKGRQKIIAGFINGVFPVYCDERHEHQMKAEKELEEEKIEEKRRRKEKKEKQEEQDKEPFDLDYLTELIINREQLPINNELF